LGKILISPLTWRFHRLDRHLLLVLIEVTSPQQGSRFVENEDLMGDSLYTIEASIVETFEVLK